MADEILASTKLKLGLPEDYAAFDDDVIDLINSSFALLQQLGVGPPEGYSISTGDELWTDFIEQSPVLNYAKELIWLNVSLMFDPPSSSFVTEAKNRRRDELIWRINVSAETKETERGESSNG